MKGIFYLTIQLILFFSIIVSAFILGGLYADYNQLKELNEVPQGTFYLNCENLSLEETANCMRSYVEPFFKYTLTPDNMTLTVEEIKTRGGDCKDWSELYKKMTPEPYYGNTLKFQTSDKTAHIVYVISDDEGYCILDQLTIVKCGELG